METGESTRLAALRRYRILDTDPEQAFDDLTLLAAHICATPIALISLADADRMWFKSRIGISATETARSIALCNDALEHAETLIIPDALADDRYRLNPMVVCDPHVRFYAGAPLITPDGFAIGTLCVIDRVPRDLNADQREALEALRRQAVAQLALRRNLLELREALGERDQAEASQARLIADLRSALGNVRKLSALIPYCSACEFDMTIPADPWKIATVTDGLKHLLTDKGWPEPRIYEVELAVQEALANAIRHGCKEDPAKQVRCSVTCDASGEIVVIVRDPGHGFDVGGLDNPLDERNLLKGSGRGIFLINGLMDEVRFEDGGREIRMRKRVDPA